MHVLRFTFVEDNLKGIVVELVMGIASYARASLCTCRREADYKS